MSGARGGFESFSGLGLILPSRGTTALRLLALHVSWVGLARWEAFGHRPLTAPSLLAGLCDRDGLHAARAQPCGTHNRWQGRQHGS